MVSANWNGRRRKRRWRGGRRERRTEDKELRKEVH